MSGKFNQSEGSSKAFQMTCFPNDMGIKEQSEDLSSFTTNAL